jgi:hypothetical protein
MSSRMKESRKQSKENQNQLHGLPLPTSKTSSAMTLKQ